MDGSINGSLSFIYFSPIITRSKSIKPETENAVRSTDIHIPPKSPQGSRNLMRVLYIVRASLSCLSFLSSLSKDEIGMKPFLWKYCVCRAKETN